MYKVSNTVSFQIMYQNVKVLMQFCVKALFGSCLVTVIWHYSLLRIQMMYIRYLSVTVTEGIRRCGDSNFAMVMSFFQFI